MFDSSNGIICSLQRAQRHHEVEVERHMDPSHQEASIAGPDLLPIVFFAEAGTSVVTYLAAAIVIMR